jgi:RNA polymerase sigma factor (TIGR02999 family)
VLPLVKRPGVAILTYCPFLDGPALSKDPYPSEALVIDDRARIASGMTTERSEEISALLVAWSNGDEDALKNVVPMIYPELRRIARRYMRQQAPNHTLESAALVNEAYLKLFPARGVRCEHRAQFLALCAQIIRRILVDHARTEGYAKRGGNAVQVSLDEAMLGPRARDVEVLALDLALTALSELDPRKSRVVELRFFGGLTQEETADVLQISPDTVLRDWKMAKVWLLRELKKR